MKTAEILESYQKVAEETQAHTGTGLPKLQPSAYSLTKPQAKNCASPVLVWAEIESFGQASGWLGYQSGNQYALELTTLQPKKEYGILLNAELANDKGQSLHIRYNSHGGWVVTTYRYEAGDEYIADEVTYFSSFDDGKKLKYLRFWKADDASSSLGINPVFACFTGFGG